MIGLLPTQNMCLGLVLPGMNSGSINKKNQSEIAGTFPVLSYFLTRYGAPCRMVHQSLRCSKPKLSRTRQFSFTPIHFMSLSLSFFFFFLPFFPSALFKSFFISLVSSQTSNSCITVAPAINSIY